MDERRDFLIKNRGLLDREAERESLLKAANSGEAAICIVYGRKHMGKSLLIEGTLSHRKLIKLAGVRGADKATQIRAVLSQFSQILGDSYIAKLNFKHWSDVFELIADKCRHGKWTIYFDELQWLAEYNDEFISSFKPFWENYFVYNPEFLLVLSGSAPAFMKGVVCSQVLAACPTHEIYLKPYSLQQTQAYLDEFSPREVLDAYLTLGGVPNYLKRLKSFPSVPVGLCKTSFTVHGFFSTAYASVLVSRFAHNVHYQPVLEYLSQVKFATRQDIETHLAVLGGGNLTDVLENLRIGGFVERYSTFQSGEKTKLVRYAIADPYLRFYFNLIKPVAAKIERGDFDSAPLTALDRSVYQKSLGFAFAQFCRKEHRYIAGILGFSAVRYRSGAFFNRHTQSIDKDFQLELVYERDDRVLVVCDIHYSDALVDIDVISQFESKLQYLPRFKKYRIEKALISPRAATEALLEENYFDHIISLNDLMS